MTMPSPIHSHPMSEVDIPHSLPPFLDVHRMLIFESNQPLPPQLDIELATLLDSLSLQQRIRVGLIDPPYLAGLPIDSDLRVEADKRASTQSHRIRHSNERRRELPSTSTSFPFPSHPLPLTPSLI